MNVFQIAEVAALVSVHSPHLIERTGPLPDESLQAYWSHSRNRHAVWRKAFERIRTPEEREFLSSLIEEVFVTEMLTRIWAGILTACDRRRRIRQAEPIARSIFVDHLECRCRAMQLLVHDSSISSTELARIDRFRRRSERWTDALLAYVIRQGDVSEFAFDSRRAREFADDAGTREIVFGHGNLPQFLLAGLRFAFANIPPKRPLDEMSHTAILQSVLACYPNDVFDQFGSIKSVLAARIGRSSQFPEQAPSVVWPLPATDAPSNPVVPRTVRFTHFRRPRTDS